jgi:hypothetical protein
LRFRHRQQSRTKKVPPMVAGRSELRQKPTSLHSASQWPGRTLCRRSRCDAMPALDDRCNPSLRRDRSLLTLCLSMPKASSSIRCSQHSPAPASGGRCCSRNRARRRAGALVQTHDDGVAVIGRAAEPLPDLVLVFDLDTTDPRFPTRCGQIRLHRGIGRQGRRAEFLPGVERLAHPPPVLGATVVEFQAPIALSRCSGAVPDKL